MLKKFAMALLFTATCFSTSVFAINYHSLQNGISKDFDFPPNDPQVFTNIFLWSITANCTIATQDQANEMIFTDLAKQGKIDDTIIIEGQSITKTYHSGDSLRIYAVSGAQVSITNYGPHPLIAHCSM